MVNANEEKILEFFRVRLEEHVDGPKAVGWKDRETQEQRFEALAGVVPLEGKSVLDLGCGLGDLLVYLRGRGWGGEYTGWDISEDMIARCRERFPEERFEAVNTVEYAGEREFDIVLASGVFAVPLADESYYEEVVRKMFGLCREAVAFNCISTYVDFREDYLNYTDPLAMFDFCKRNLTRYVTLRHDYMRFEFTVYAYRREG